MSDEVVCIVQPGVVVEVIQPHVEVIEVVSGIPGIPGEPGEKGDQGEPGVPGESAGDIIDAQGDLIAGDIAGDAGILPVGAVGSYLAPEPTAPLGLEWKPLPVPEPGLKEYPDLAALDAVRVAEIGTVLVPDLAAAFPHLVSQFPDEFSGHGPAQLTVISTMADYPMDSPAAIAPRRILHQTFTVPSWVEPYEVRIIRTIMFDSVTGVASYTQAWVPGPYVPITNYEGYVPISAGTIPATWNLSKATPSPEAQMLLRRDAFGRAQVVAPDPAGSPEQIATMGFVDAAIAGAGLKVYPDRAALNLVNVARGPSQITAAVGPVRIDYMNGIGWVVEPLVPPVPVDAGNPKFGSHLITEGKSYGIPGVTNNASAAPAVDIIGVFVARQDWRAKVKSITVNHSVIATEPTLVEFGLYDGITKALLCSFGTIDLSTPIGVKQLTLPTSVEMPELCVWATKLLAASANGGQLRMTMGSPLHQVGNPWDAPPSSPRGFGYADPGVNPLPAVLPATESSASMATFTITIEPVA